MISSTCCRPVSATPDSVFRTVRRGLGGGGTILLHDSDVFTTPRSWENAIGALPAILTLCQARGYAVGPLSEHGISRPASALLKATRRRLGPIDPGSRT